MEDSQPTSREVVRVLAALSDENRFRIVELLAEEEGELSCGAIGQALDLSPSLLSHHLAILADAGIVGRRKNGLWTMNGLKRSVIERQLQVLDDLVRRDADGTVRLSGLENGAGPTDTDPTTPTN
ncbi:MAG: ArsR/SmtB family transcription factor [Gemmatimonadota bacterium]